MDNAGDIEFKTRNHYDSWNDSYSAADFHASVMLHEKDDVVMDVGVLTSSGWAHDNQTIRHQEGVERAFALNSMWNDLEHSAIEGDFVVTFDLKLRCSDGLGNANKHPGLAGPQGAVYIAGMVHSALNANDKVSPCLRFQSGHFMRYESTKNQLTRIKWFVAKLCRGDLVAGTTQDSLYESAKRWIVEILNVEKKEISVVTIADLFPASMLI